MNCPNCGAQYDPSMRNCPSCGSENPNPVYQAPMPPPTAVYTSYPVYTQTNPYLMALINEASSAYNFALAGLISTLLCGCFFGWIFAIVSHSKYNSINSKIGFGGFPMNDYNVIEAQKKLSTTKTLNIITLVLTVLGAVGFVVSLVLNLAVLSSGAYYYY